MPFLKINGFQIYYEDYGEGETIILIHHGFGSTRIWEEIYQPLADRGYRVVMYDRRGFGRSDKGDDFMEFYVSQGYRAAAVRELAALRDALGIETFHLVGQCEGGVLAVDYALDYPEHVMSIVISSTQCYSKVSMPELNQEKFPKVFRELDPNLQAKLNLCHGEEHAEPFFNLFRIHGGHYGTGFFDIRPLLPSISCPALVLYPDRSFLFDVEQAVAFYRLLRRGELAVFPNCGHNNYDHRPAEYVKEVLDFVERHSGEEDTSAHPQLAFTCVS